MKVQKWPAVLAIVLAVAADHLVAQQRLPADGDFEVVQIHPNFYLIAAAGDTAGTTPLPPTPVPNR
jgi:hypothetical protein